MTLISWWLINKEVSDTYFPTFHLRCHIKHMYSTVQETVANDYIKNMLWQSPDLHDLFFICCINIRCLMKFIFINNQYFSRNILRPQRWSKPVLLTDSKSAISLLTVWKQIVTSSLGFFEATSFFAIKVPVSQMFEHQVRINDFALAKRATVREE